MTRGGGTTFQLDTRWPRSCVHCGRGDTPHQGPTAMCPYCYACPKDDSEEDCLLPENHEGPHRWQVPILPEGKLRRGQLVLLERDAFYDAGLGIVPASECSDRVGRFKRAEESDNLDDMALLEIHRGRVAGKARNSTVRVELASGEKLKYDTRDWTMRLLAPPPERPLKWPLSRSLIWMTWFAVLIAYGLIGNQVLFDSSVTLRKWVYVIGAIFLIVWPIAWINYSEDHPTR